MRGDRASVARRLKPNGNEIVIKGQFWSRMNKDATCDEHTHTQQDGNVGTKVMVEIASLLAQVFRTVNKSY